MHQNSARGDCAFFENLETWKTMYLFCAQWTESVERTSLQLFKAQYLWETQETATPESWGHSGVTQDTRTRVKHHGPYYVPFWIHVPFSWVVVDTFELEP